MRLIKPDANALEVVDGEEEVTREPEGRRTFSAFSRTFSAFSTFNLLKSQPSA